MSPTQIYLTALAHALASTNTTMSVSDLVNHLNRLKLTYGNGKPFLHKRCSYTYIGALYRELDKQGRHNDAVTVAVAFPKPDGSYAYD
jgi:hypothetical protein